MSSDDEDSSSSLHLQTLLPLSDPSSQPSTDRTDTDTSNLDGSVDAPTTHRDDDKSSISDSARHHPPPQTPDRKGNQTRANTDSSTAAGKDPLSSFDCYKWLLNVKERKISETAASSDSAVSSSSASSEESLSPLPVPKPPDGGWGWMVVLGSFLILVICDGLSYSFGVLYSELLLQFGDTRSKTSLVGSIFFGVSMILGPFAGAMTTKFGCRKVTIAGGLLSSFGFILSYFATSIEMLCITFSVIVGIGFSFCFVTSVVIVHFYFDKRRSFATGLAVCGTGVGTFSFAPLMEYLISEYDCRGLFLIMGGISLNLVVCGLLFRPLQFTEEERRRYFHAEFDKLPSGRESLELGRMRNISECTEFTAELEVLDEESRTMSMLSLPTFACGGTTAATQGSSDILIEAVKNSRNPHLTFHRYLKNAYFRSDDSQDNNDDDVEEDSKGKLISKPFVRDGVPVSLDSDQPTSNSMAFSEYPPPSYNKLFPNAVNVTDPSTKSSPDFIHHGQTISKSPTIPETLKLPPQKATVADTLKGGDQSQRSSFYDLSSEMRRMSVSKVVSGVHMGKHNAMGIQLLLYRQDIFYRRHLSPSRYNLCLMGTSCPELIESNVQPQSPDKWKGYWQSVKLSFTRMFDLLMGTTDWRLFTNFFFTCFVVSNFIFYFWSDIPYMYAIDHALGIGIDSEDASFLISIIGIFNTIGQVIFGAVGDMKVNLVMVYAIVLTTSGIFVGIVPLMDVYWCIAASYSLFGFFVSVTFPFSTVLLVNYLGVQHLTNAYGLLMLMQGIANILGPPFAGWISDVTASYDEAFYLSGAFYALSGLVMFLVLIHRCCCTKTDDANTALEGENEKC